MKLNLWSNRCDLSITSGREINLVHLFNSFSDLDDFIIINDAKQIYQCIVSGIKEESIIDFVIDNAGFEFFTDLCLADYIIRNKLANMIRFHVKSIPWFVSDVKVSDFNFTLKILRSHSDDNLSMFGQRCIDYLSSGKFVLVEPVHWFWTTAYEFKKMKKMDSSLYDLLSESHLIIFKGDLNYRKLLGDLNWSYIKSFQEVVREFKPANLCVLRTIKSDIICGLQKGTAENLFKRNANWMATGVYGIIQFASKDSVENEV